VLSLLHSRSPFSVRRSGYELLALKDAPDDVRLDQVRAIGERAARHMLCDEAARLQHTDLPMATDSHGSCHRRHGRSCGQQVLGVLHPFPDELCRSATSPPASLRRHDTGLGPLTDNRPFKLWDRSEYVKDQPTDRRSIGQH
jgi:hypothetical protein